jgi:hypothetical protein
MRTVAYSCGVKNFGLNGVRVSFAARLRGLRVLMRFLRLRLCPRESGRDRPRRYHAKNRASMGGHKSSWLAISSQLIGSQLVAKLRAER